MKYDCLNCDWSGSWDELVLETMCPKCRSGVARREQQRLVPVTTDDGAMKYHCEDCGWSGTWDELTLETMCPACKAGAKPVLAPAHIPGRTNRPQPSARSDFQ